MSQAGQGNVPQQPDSRAAHPPNPTPQAQAVHPQYSQQQYAQPQYAQPQYGAPQQPPAVAGRWHSPVIALLLALIVPGLGQAYNGQPVKGFFLLVVSPLVLPNIYAIINAFTHANYMRKTGGRYGKGGVVWIILHLWLVLNFALFALLILTIAGVLS